MAGIRARTVGPSQQTERLGLAVKSENVGYTSLEAARLDRPKERLTDISCLWKQMVLSTSKGQYGFTGIKFRRTHR